MKNIKGFDAIPVDFKKMADLDIAQYSYYEHLQNRELILNQDIDESILEKFTLQVIKWNREDVGKPISMRKPIKIYINSCGGSVMDGMNFVDTILNSKTPVYTIVQAYAYSMGCLISIAGHKRYGYPNSTLLLHDGSAGCVTSGSKFADVSKFYRETEERTKQYVLSKTKMPEDLYDEKYGSEFYMYGSKGKELGFLDFIIGEDVDLEEVLKL